MLPLLYPAQGMVVLALEPDVIELARYENCPLGNPFDWAVAAQDTSTLYKLEPVLWYNVKVSCPLDHAGL